MSKPMQKRLFCLPPAGAGTTIFQPLQQIKVSGIDICPVQLPGRENRFQEPIPTSIERLAAQMAEELRPLTDRPYAILGYSMGASIGYEMVRQWHFSGVRLPSEFFALAARPPHVASRGENAIHQLKGDEFRQALARLGGTPAELLENDEIMSIYEPIIRRDFLNCHHFQSQPIANLNLPITALVSDGDTMLNIDEASAWEDCTAGRFSLEVLRGEPHIVASSKLERIGWRLVEEMNGDSP
ncbi:MAG: thioesterase [Planctomycetaceae bacterium]|nr:thioesterase [Planctomycetaceae bacterium]